MTPPQRKKSPLRPFSLSLAAATLVAGLMSPPSHATEVPTKPARATLEGLNLISEPTVPTLRDMVVRAGLDYIGTPYTWGGNDPDDGFDCSGLVSFVYREVAGVELPRTARAQRQVGKQIDRNHLKPGDLVFFTTRGRRGGISHVGMYIGHDEFVHAPNHNTTVRVDSLDNSYWQRHYAGARRYLDSGKTLMASVDGQP